MKLTYKCPLCSKDLKLKEEILFGTEKLYSYQCGHIFAKTIEEFKTEELDFTSADNSGKAARHYQEAGIKFILDSGFNCIIGDQMRLGKTPQALLALKNQYKERTPVLILVKSANLWQWIREYKIWCDTLPNGIYPVVGGTAFIPAGFSAYICSMDTFSLNARCKCGHTYHEERCSKKECDCRIYNAGSESIRDKLQKLPFKLVIADEAHSFKNSDSNRSQAIVKFMNFMNTGESHYDIKFTCPKCQHEWTEEANTKFDKRIGHQVLHKDSRCPQCRWYCYMQAQGNETMRPEDSPCGLVLLTGTPILNRADEYFVPLNLVNPEKFSSQTRFQNEWLEADHKGRYSRVKSYKLQQFKDTIKPYLLRREKEDVYTDLPVINRIFTLIEPDKTKVKERYNQILDKIDAETAHKANPTYWDLKEHISELRRLCGMMKLMWINDYLETCAIESSSKYAIGIHHESVRDVLYTMLGGDMNCYRLSGADSSDRKDAIMRNWEHSNKQFLIINMLAGGVGMDFHYCDNVVILERQWNSEIEAQFEFRFYNPDKSIKQNSTTIEYVIAKGTIDEFWYDMVEDKRRNVGEVMYNNFDIEKDVDSFRSLIERTLGARQ